MAIWLAVTGNIGSGKSTVTKILAGLGAGVVDADIEAHTLAVEDAEYRAALTERFGDGLFSIEGGLDRTVLAQRLFGDPVAVSDFNAIVAPRLVARTRTKLRKFADECPVVVLDGALIFEYGRHADFDEVWLVVSDLDIVVERLAKKGYTRDQVERRRAAQWSEAVKIPMATRVLYNNGSPEELGAIVNELWQNLISEKR